MSDKTKKQTQTGSCCYSATDKVKDDKTWFAVWNNTKQIADDISNLTRIITFVQIEQELKDCR